MFRLKVVSFLFLITAGYGATQSAPDYEAILKNLLVNPDLLKQLQAPEVETSLLNLLERLNTTGENLTVAYNAIANDTALSNLAGVAAEAVFSSLTKSQMAANLISESCQEDVVMLLEGLAGRADWALHMVDAMGKPGTNLMSGQTKFLGSYDECVSTEAVWADPGSRQGHSFTGKYCNTVFLQGAPSPLLVFGAGYLVWGVCVPNTCSGDDVTNLVKTAEKALFNNTAPIPPYTTVCPDDNSGEYGADFVTAVVILGIIGLLVLLGTLYDVMAVQLKTTKSTSSGNSNNGAVVLTHGVFNANGESNAEKSGNDLPSPTNGTEKSAVYTVPSMENGHALVKDLTEKPREKSPLERVLLAFSVYTNGVKILSTNQSGSLGAVNGIRFLSMAWVILGHSYYFAARYDANLLQHVLKKQNDWTFMAIVYADVSVDSFFVLSGLLVAYLALGQLKKLGGPKKLNWFMYYFHRFWRLTPAYMLIMMVGTIILPYVLDGPLWDGKEVPTMEPCRRNWWSNLLYVNNYVNVHDMCMGWSWYLANDMQFYWISPLLLIPLFFHIAWGSVVCLVFSLASIVTVGVIAHDHGYHVQQISMQFVQPSKDGDFDANLYVPSYARIAPYIAGVFTGYLLVRYKCKCRIPKAANLACWLLSIGLATTIVYVRFSKGPDHILSQLDSAVFMALHRAAWGVALAWMIFACATGNGGWINEVLSWKPFIPLGRLSYCAYLIHPLVMHSFYASRRVTTYLTDYEVMYLFMAHMSMTYGLSFLASLVFESPMMALEKVIFNRK